MDAFDLRLWEGFVKAGGDPAKHSIVDQIAIDSRRIHSENSLFVALQGSRVDGHHFIEQAANAGAKFALVSQSWQSSSSDLKNITLLRTSEPLQALQSIAKAYRQSLPVKILGITGSFGKTMVKDLIYTFLKGSKKVAASPESFNSQIGVSLSLFTLNHEHEIALIEAAISKKDEMDKLAEMIAPNYTLLSPVGKKHLPTLHDVDTALNETTKLLRVTSPEGWILLPNELFSNSKESFPARHFFWDQTNLLLPHSNPIEGSLSQYQIKFPDGSAFQGKIHSGHAYFLNLVNMAVKSAWLMGIEKEKIISVLENYHVEPTRTEIWKAAAGRVVINEPYCSDPLSIDLSLEHFKDAAIETRKIFVFGGMRNDSSFTYADYRRIGQSMAQSDLNQLILVGQKPYEPLIEEVSNHSIKTEIIAFEDYGEALSYLQQDTHEQDLIIFKGEKKIPFDTLAQTFNGALAHNQCIINLAAIEANLAIIRKKLPPDTRLMVMVKASAYGTDDVRMAKFLHHCGIDILGVSYIDEGIALKRAGAKQSIFLIHAALFEIAQVVKWDLEVGVSDSTFIHALAKEASLRQKKIKVHLHINTGMGRFGCRPEMACELARLIHSFPSLVMEGVMTHFACAENPDEDAFTRKQIEIFDRVNQELAEQGFDAKWKHAANSSGALRFHLPQYNMVRLGLAVYGLHGSDAAQGAADLRLSLSLLSRIIHIGTHHCGETVSYGRNYLVENESQKIAVLPIGYFDGIHRHYSGKACVLIRGQKAPLIGNITMDYLMVDVSNISDATVGDQVLIFGEDEYGFYLSPEEFALSGNSIIHELITCLGPRIQRIFVHEEGKQIR